MNRLVVGFALVICFCGSMISNAQEQPDRLPNRPTPQSGIIVGTITDVNNGTVPGATVALESPSLSDPRVILSNDNGFFQFNNVEPGTYQITVSAPGFAEWNSRAIILKPGQYEILTGSKLQIAKAVTTINVVSPVASPEEIAAEQVKVAEQQRIFGFIPNFYVNYDGNNAAPLTSKLKFKLALKVLVDPVTVFGVAGFAAIDQAADNPNFPEGAKVTPSALARAILTARSTSWSAAPSCHRFCTRTRVTFTKARAPTSRARCTHSPAGSSAVETTVGCSRTTRLSVAIWPRWRLRMPTIRSRIVTWGFSWGISSSPLASARSRTWPRSSS